MCNKHDCLELSENKSVGCPGKHEPIDPKHTMVLYAHIKFKLIST